MSGAAATERDRPPAPAPDVARGEAAGAPVQSMTGFARHAAEDGYLAFVWELKSVNAKALDVKLKLPQTYDALEPALRKRVAARFARGTIQASLQVRDGGERPALSVNEAMLGELLALSDRLVRDGHASLPSADGLLAIKGVMEVAEPEIDEAERSRRLAFASTSFETALDALAGSRAGEGAALARVVGEKLDRIERLTAEAEGDPTRTLDAIRERVAAQVAALDATATAFDTTRLHQEAAIIAARVDIREELDRLGAHLAAARALLAAGGPMGRRLDFLAQEFNRESNTICSKANSSSLSAIGLELKVVVDQMREQVQNLE